jgi:hypothetical protein
MGTGREHRKCCLKAFLKTSPNQPQERDLGRLGGWARVTDNYSVHVPKLAPRHSIRMECDQHSGFYLRDNRGQNHSKAFCLTIYNSIG